MSGTNIMDIEVKKLDEDLYQVWFVAISGEHGPIMKMPKSLLLMLKEKIESALK